MKSLYRAAPLLLLALVGCQNRQLTGEAPPTAHDVAAHTTGLGSTSGRLDANAVWNGTLQACRSGSTAIDDCLISTMRASGASASALSAARHLSALGNPGHVSVWRALEGVGVATLEFPFRANTNQGTWLVDSSGKTIDVDEPLGDTQILASADYQTFLQQHPDVSPFAPAVASGSETLPDGGVRLRYSTPLRSCHACAQDGTLTIGYDFDDERVFIGRQLLQVK